MVIKFRLAEKRDFKKIAEIHATNWKENYRGIMSDDYLDHRVEENRKREWKDRMMYPARNQYVLLAIENHEIIGFVCLFTKECIEFGSYLDNIHVIKSCIGRGIGTKLMKKAAQYIDEQLEDKRMYLWVLEKNVKATKLYKRLGGQIQDKIYKDVHGAGVLPIVRIVWQNVEILL